MADRRPQPQVIAPTASAEEAAAIVAALERFMRATTPPAVPTAEDTDPWRRAAILEGVSREPQGDVSGPWQGEVSRPWQGDVPGP